MSDAILVAEDEPSSAEYLRLLLEGRGHSVRLAANGVEALLALESRPFDLVITDLRMPSMDGFELLVASGTALARSAGDRAHGQRGRRGRRRGGAAWCVNYLLKPATPASVGAASIARC